MTTKFDDYIARQNEAIKRGKKAEINGRMAKRFARNAELLKSLSDDELLIESSNNRLGMHSVYTDVRFALWPPHGYVEVADPVYRKLQHIQDEAIKRKVESYHSNLMEGTLECVREAFDRMERREMGEREYNHLLETNEYELLSEFYWGPAKKESKTT